MPQRWEFGWGDGGGLEYFKSGARIALFRKIRIGTSAKRGLFVCHLRIVGRVSCGCFFDGARFVLNSNCDVGFCIFKMSLLSSVFGCLTVCLLATTMVLGVLGDEKTPITLEQHQYVATTTPASKVSTKAPSRYRLHKFIE